MEDRGFQTDIVWITGETWKMYNEYEKTTRREKIRIDKLKQKSDNVQIIIVGKQDGEQLDDKDDQNDDQYFENEMKNNEFGMKQKVQFQIRKKIEQESKESKNDSNRDNNGNNDNNNNNNPNKEDLFSDDEYSFGSQESDDDDIEEGRAVLDSFVGKRMNQLLVLKEACC
ncbi:MAG: hypothetical protein EZS28_000232 [Streblomastix strix]|uniref:Uncharacterized protein n=1 Tax=Streblomastix strix TaxID=222440 RepID=A0A5J4XCJ6_9EUKA|nr:MAG: hypothetical protein EZS28_000232 [Streblomastix strix]